MASLLAVLLFLFAIQTAVSVLFCHDVGDSTETCASTHLFCYRHEKRAGCISACGYPNTTCGYEDAKIPCCCKTNYCNKLNDNGRSTTTIIFIILGVLLFVGIVIGLIVFCILRQRKKTEEKAYTPID